MAAYRAGALDGLPSVNECRLSPDLWDKLGCEKPPQLVAADGRTFPDSVVKIKFGNSSIEYMRHPELFITDTIRSWFNEYEYYGENYSLVPYHERHACWVECLKLYKTYMGVFKNV